MRILLTGGAGFIGSHIADMLLSRSHEVVIADNLSTGNKENLPQTSENLRFYPIDITNGMMVNDLFMTEKPDLVCHQAAQASLLSSHLWPDEDALVNTIGTIRLLQAAKRSGCTRFVMASTMAVFPNSIEAPDENTIPCPERPYGISKLAAELYVRNSGLKWTILRYGNVYGPRQVPIGENQLIARLFSFAFLGRPDFSIYGDGDNTRDFIFVEDIARANVGVIANGLVGTFHLGTGIPHSVNEIVDLVRDAVGVNLQNIPHTAAKDEPRFLRVKTHRSILLIPGYYPHTSLRDGLQKTYFWWLNHGMNRKLNQNV